MMLIYDRTTISPTMQRDAPLLNGTVSAKFSISTNARSVRHRLSTSLGASIVSHSAKMHKKDLIRKCRRSKLEREEEKAALLQPRNRNDIVMISSELISDN